MKNRKLYKIVLCCMLFVSPFLTMAQADDLGGGNDGGDVNDNSTPAAPIDDYVSFAVVAALGLGYVVLSKKKIAQIKR